MKKVLTVALAAVGAGLFGIGVTSMTKKAVTYSVIGRADGPTSIFLAGKIGGSVWWALMITGGVIFGLSAALFAFLVRKKK